MVSESFEVVKDDNGNRVLILVVMEDGLRDYYNNFNSTIAVLILVVMEDGLRGCSSLYYC